MSVNWADVRAVVMCAVVTSACVPSSTAPVSPPVQWDLVWSDEFQGEAGSSPNPNIWVFDQGGDGWGNQQLEYNTNRAENASLDGDGHLTIVARKEKYLNNDYTSARIKTLGKKELRYGRIEARIKLPRGQGIWPAFWMLGSSFEDVGWPKCGEIDVMEYRGQQRFEVQGSLHGPKYSAGECITKGFKLQGDRGFDEDFHVFAVEWDPGRLTWAVDGEVYHVVDSAAVTAKGPWVFHEPFFLILNVAVGGAYVGQPDATTEFPQTMLVDYVRVFKRRAL